jgi:hypothetical protein
VLLLAVRSEATQPRESGSVLDIAPTLVAGESRKIA